MRRLSLQHEAASKQQQQWMRSCRVCCCGAVQTAVMRHHLALFLLNLSLAPQGGEQVVMVSVSKDANQEKSCAQLKNEPAGQLA